MTVIGTKANMSTANREKMLLRLNRRRRMVSAADLTVACMLNPEVRSQSMTATKILPTKTGTNRYRDQPIDSRRYHAIQLSTRKKRLCRTMDISSSSDIFVFPVPYCHAL